MWEFFYRMFELERQAASFHRKMELDDSDNDSD